MVLTLIMMTKKYLAQSPTSLMSMMPEELTPKIQLVVLWVRRPILFHVMNNLLKVIELF